MEVFGEKDYLPIYFEGKKCYDIVFEQSFEKLSKEMKFLQCSNRKICIVTDSNVGALYTKELFDVLKMCAENVVVFTFTAGERNKNLDTVKDLYTFLIQNKFDRNDILVALGGGVVGDLTGYTAATYLRGIRFIQIPTSLLAMVDSSIGGKTGVDFDAYKNMIGAFYMPKLVYMNLSVLQTLDFKQFHAGFGEVIKHGLIFDASYLTWIMGNHKLLEEREYGTLKYMVKRNCEIKKDVVEKDPLELGVRALLNFGHTIGHAIEKLKDFTWLHGECVAVGMVASAYISYKRGNLSENEFSMIEDIMKAYSLPVKVFDISCEDVISATFHDKKKDGNKINFILLKSIGHAIIDPSVTVDEMKEATMYLLGKEAL